MNIDKDFQSGIKKVKDLVKAIHPEISDRDLSLIESECKSMVQNVILTIGNSINSKTHEL